MKLIDADKLKEKLLCMCGECKDDETDWCEHCCPIAEFISMIEDEDYILISNDVKDIADFLMKGEKE